MADTAGAKLLKEKIVQKKENIKHLEDQITKHESEARVKKDQKNIWKKELDELQADYQKLTV